MNPRQEGAPGCNKLFVYGTLRRGFRLHHHLVRLGARFESEAKVPGALFDLGSYPGAKPDTKGNAWITGEIFHLPDIESDLRVLDEIEEFNPDDPARSLFIRSKVDAVLSDGVLTTAWIYWFAGESATELNKITSGDYSTIITRKEL